MKVVNRSKIPTAELLPLLKFALKKIKRSNLATLYFEDGRRGGEGETWMWAPSGYQSESPTRPACVIVRVAPRDSFRPYRDQYVTSLPVEFKAWEEEVLVVLAHELKHLDDFWTVGETTEEGAESFALATLKSWRSLTKPQKKSYNRSHPRRNPDGPVDRA
jgi:hypothetical protein